MGLQREEKIKKLIRMLPQGAVATSGWLESIGISRQLRRKHLGGWIERVGQRAYKKAGDEISWQAGVYAIQAERRTDIHTGALTALSMHGLSHYLRSSREVVFIFSPSKKKLPGWFRKYDWKVKIEGISTSFIPMGMGLVDHEQKSFSLKISSPERAILECLYLAPGKVDLLECYQIMEGLTNLRPRLVKALLQKCASVKVKRLFLFMAEKAGHAWLKYVNLNGVDLGKGQRSLVKGGVYIPKYKIMVPGELADR
jgi:hypothetical protein